MADKSLGSIVPVDRAYSDRLDFVYAEGLEMIRLQEKDKDKL